MTLINSGFQSRRSAISCKSKHKPYNNKNQQAKWVLGVADGRAGKDEPEGWQSLSTILKHYQKKGVQKGIPVLWTKRDIINKLEAKAVAVGFQNPNGGAVIEYDATGLVTKVSSLLAHELGHFGGYQIRVNGVLTGHSPEKEDLMFGGYTVWSRPSKNWCTAFQITVAPLLDNK